MELKVLVASEWKKVGVFITVRVARVPSTTNIQLISTKDIKSGDNFYFLERIVLNRSELAQLSLPWTEVLNLSRHVGCLRTPSLKIDLNDFKIL